MKTSQSIPPFARHASALAPLTAALCLFVLPLSFAAAGTETDQTGRWWGSVELGAGQLHRTVPGISDNGTHFYLGFEGGMAVNPQVLLGLELSGWTIQSANAWDPTQGSGIQQIYAVAKFYPQPGSSLRLHVGAGSFSGWDNSPTGSRRNGSGWEAGIEYDLSRNSRGGLVPFLRYANGKAGNMKLSAVTLGVGYSWR